MGFTPGGVTVNPVGRVRQPGGFHFREQEKVCWYDWMHCRAFFGRGDNAPSHTCSKVTDYLAKKGIATVPQPPYSPDLAPADFILMILNPVGA
jgi:hypothetical protein